jgi:hypothetical protein
LLAEFKRALDPQGIHVTVQFSPVLALGGLLTLMTGDSGALSVAVIAVNQFLRKANEKYYQPTRTALFIEVANSKNRRLLLDNKAGV